jgi:hypothetical protein
VRANVYERVALPEGQSALDRQLRLLARGVEHQQDADEDVERLSSQMRTGSAQAQT